MQVAVTCGTTFIYYCPLVRHSTTAYVSGKLGEGVEHVKTVKVNRAGRHRVMPQTERFTQLLNKPGQLTER